MTIVTIDTETQGLDTNKFRMGAICHEDFSTESFNSKGAMWRRLMDIAEEHRKKKKCVIYYAHNMRYDYYAIRPKVEPKNAIKYSDDPFIVDFEDENHRIYAKFTSTTSLWRGTLASLGEAIGYKKDITPEWLKKDEYEPSMQELAEAAEYNRQDVKVLMHYLQDLKAKLKDVGMRPRWILTAAQVGISNLLNQLVKEENADDFFKDKMHKALRMTNYPRSIWAACRGGRTQVLFNGTEENVTAIDINSAYPYHLATMRMPNLKRERCFEKPLVNGLKLDWLLGEIGVSCATVFTSETRYGVLPIRPDADYVYWPKRANQTLRGVWTHQELTKAVAEGHVIKDIDWSIIYEETGNPFRGIVKQLYDMKLNARNDSDKAFAKMLLNGPIGKFSQIREQATWEWADVRETEARTTAGWTIEDQDGVQRLFKKITGSSYPRWYAPIINALIRADAQLRLLNDMEQLLIGEVLYTDTDSLFLRSGKDNATIKYSNSLGGYKLIGNNLTLTVWGKKAYRVGDDVKLSGAGNITETDLARGTVTARRMLSDHETADKAKAGTFITIEHDLNVLAAEQAAKERAYEQEAFIVDERLVRLEEQFPEEHSCERHTQRSPSF